MTKKMEFENEKVGENAAKENTTKENTAKENTAKDVQKPNVPEGLMIKCGQCGAMLLNDELLNNMKVCTGCGYLFRMSAKERINITADKGTFVETGKGIFTGNPIDFPGYNEKIKKLQDDSGLDEAVITGICEISGNKTMLGVMDGNFMMGSMGFVVGEKITQLFEDAIENKSPVVIFTVSGGARMQEGTVSLMQMAKTSAAVSRHSKEGLLYIVVLTDPTTGGVTASFAMLGDIIISEPGALIGFAGPRVIEQTIKQKLPEGFQRAEFLKDHGAIDKIVNRKEMKEMLGKLLLFHRG